MNSKLLGMLETWCVLVNSEVSECWALHERVRRLYPLSKEVLILRLSPASVAGVDLILKYQFLSRLSRSCCINVTHLRAFIMVHFYYSYKICQQWFVFKEDSEDKVAIRDVWGDDTVLSYLREDCKEGRKAAWHGSGNSGPSQVIWSTLLLVPWLRTHISAWVNTLVSSETQVLAIPVPWHFVKSSTSVLPSQGPIFSFLIFNNLGWYIFSVRSMSRAGFSFFLCVCFNLIKK